MRCRALLCLLVLTCQYHSKYYTTYRYYQYYTRFVHITLLNHKQCTTQLRSARLYIAQQRSAVQCVLRCCVVRRRAFFPAYSSSTTTYDAGTRYRYARVMYLYFCISSVDCPLSIPMPPPPRKLHMYCRSERDINEHSTAQGNY